MIQSKKRLKKRIFVFLFVLTILLTNIQIFLDTKTDFYEVNQNNFNQYNEFPSSSAPYLSDYYITGSGDSQDVRIYAENDSYSINKEGSFEIPSLSNSDTAYLSYGNFNFTFQNNYTTSYDLENTDALNANEFIKFDWDYSLSSITVNNGTSLDSLNLNKLIDTDNGTYISFNATNGIVNFTLAADFTGSSFSSTDPTFSLNFNRSLILGLIFFFTLQLTSDAQFTLKMLDISDSTWKNITKPILINSSLGFQDFEERIINENLNFIDLSNINYLQFYFRRTTPQECIVRLTEFNMYSTYGFDLPIASNKFVALEFDLMGNKSTVNGFYAWIRTLDQNEAVSTELNITLYEANTTIVRTPSNLRGNNLEPNYAKPIDSIIIDNYYGDNLTFFEFNTVNTKDLKLFNYFIVIKSNRSEIIYSLVTIPRFTFGDPDNSVDHQLRMSSNSGQDWGLARKNVLAQPTPYLSEHLDASSFKINVTRGYMPSDFWKSEDDNLNIQNSTIEDQIDNSGPYENSSYLTWGLGQWKNNFTVPISAVPPSDFTVNLNWNKSIVKGFQFNVTYSVIAYWIESTTTTYNVTYDTLPEWTLSFDLILGHSNFDNWNFLEFWFVYPNYYDTHNVTNPINEELYFKTEGESSDVYKTAYDKTIVNKTLVNGISGTYTLEATSPNIIHKTHSFINYAGTFWETNGFMFGDDMTASVDIKDQNGNPPKNGLANVTLFYPENPGGEYPGGTRIDLTGVVKNGLLRYDFNNDTLLQIRNTLSYFGHYYLGFFWTNGSAIGCEKLKLYIDAYDVEMDDCFYEPNFNVNILDGSVTKVSLDLDYSILIGTVNVTEPGYKPNYYSVNQSDINEEYIFEISGVEIPIVLRSFLQNETILNPEEDVNIMVSLQNMFQLGDVKVKVNFQLLSLANDEWIIEEQISGTKILKLKGDPLGRDIQEFSMNLNIPQLQGDGIWQGVNAPIRKGGVKTRITIFLEYSGEDIELGMFESSDYALLVNSTQNDFEGQIVALKYDIDRPWATILKAFERDECIYLPNQTTFVINIYDKNFVSSYNEFIDSFTLKLNSQFDNVTINPELPNRGQNFNISSILTTEFGKTIPSKNVTLQYYDENSWVNVSWQYSDINGSVNIEVDLLALNEEDELLFRLIWSGDLYKLSNSRNITVNVYSELNDITLALMENVPHIFRNRKSTIKLTLTNNGTSELYLSALNITISSMPNLQITILEIDLLKLNQFKPGEITTIIIEVDVTALDKFTLNVSIVAQNRITLEYARFQTSKDFEVFDVPLEDYLTILFPALMISALILIWLIGYLLVRRFIRKIETPIEEPIKKKKGRYVKVSEIKKEPKIVEKEKKVTDLDSLLEEEGFKDKKKK